MIRPDLVILGSLVSEKAVTLSASKVYTLKVALKATKDDVRKALKQVFQVDAVDVNTSILRGDLKKKARSKRSGAVMVKSPNMKKAFVTLKEGQELPYAVAQSAPES